MKPKATSNGRLISAFAAFSKKQKKKKIITSPHSPQASTFLHSTPSTSSELEIRVKQMKKKGIACKCPTQEILEKERPDSPIGAHNIIVPCGNINAERCFRWLISPFKVDRFFKDVWEIKPMHVRRGFLAKDRYLFSCDEFDTILKENVLMFKEHIDVVSYVDGVKKVHTPDGRAYAPIIWDFYQNGCSIRLLNPQTYCKALWRVSSLLQEFFGSFVGANMYLTPPNSQGFAPHYDDIDAFILQLEGRKSWKICSPATTDYLPRFSSGNLSEEDLGQPNMECELLPGDVLYIPRGFVHQAKSSVDQHSLHITLSTCQRHTWGDLLEKMLPRALQLAIEEDGAFRHSLPKDYMNYVGVVNADNECPERNEFISTLIDLTERVVRYLPIDSACDQNAKEFIHSSLPPFLTKDEKQNSIHSKSPIWTDNGPQQFQQFEPCTEVRLIRKRAVRLVMEEECIRLYHTLENTRIYQEREPQYVQLDAKQAILLEQLLNTYPDFVKIEDLPTDNLDEKMDFANLMYDKGLLMTQEPLAEMVASDSS